jgi:hypothetical protein
MRTGKAMTNYSKSRSHATDRLGFFNQLHQLFGFDGKTAPAIAKQHVDLAKPQSKGIS